MADRVREILAKPRRLRTKSDIETLRTKGAIYGGCCDRFADYHACDCYERAVDDSPRCPLCRGSGWTLGGRLDNDTETVPCECDTGRVAGSNPAPAQEE